MDPEQRFLQARQARWLALSTSSSTTSSSRATTVEALAAFWTALRQLLVKWNQRLQVASLNRQECLNLKEELHAVRQACLNPTSTSSSSSSGTTEPPFGLPVPQDLPAADWRVLHAEFTRQFQAWEELFAERFPRGKFTFGRYRQEVARRTALGIPLEEASGATTKHQKDALVTPSTSTMSQMDENSSIQNISDATIHIQRDGSLWIQTSHDQESSFRVPMSSGAILLRCISNSTIQIDKPLDALHLVKLYQTTVTVSAMVASSIHVTHCEHCHITGMCQQLRIHESTHVRFQVDSVAGAILEDSTEIVFVASNSSVNAVDVKDFNWLRSGVPSPNFRIEEEELSVEKVDGVMPLEITMDEDSSQEPAKVAKTLSELSVNPAAFSVSAQQDETALPVTNKAEDSDDDEL